jgi:putative ribosome biogenesis GTPase RsgA
MSAATSTTMEASACTTMEASAAPHSVRAAKAASSVEASVTRETAMLGMPRPVVGAVIKVIIVVSLMMLPFTKASLITKVLAVAPIAKVGPIAKVTEVIKIVVEVAEEENRSKAHVKR